MNIYDLWGHWAVQTITYEEMTAGSKIVATTNNAVHLTMKWKKKPPFLRKKWKIVRGEKVLCKPSLVWRGATLQVQDEAGDTLIHTFTPIAWPVCETHWFMFTGTNGGEVTFSKSPVFNHHHTALPYGPPVTVYFYPDKHPETTTVDGDVSRYVVAETFLVLRNGAGTHAYPSTTNYPVGMCASATLDRFGNIDRGIFLFNTTSIPAGSLIDVAEVRLYIGGKGATLFPNPSWAIVGSNPAGNIDLIPADYQCLGSLELSDIKAYASIVSFSVNTWVLNASGIAAIIAGGITKLGIREYSKDCTGSTPPWISNKSVYMTVRYADFDPASRPRLKVTYRPPT